MPYGSHTTLWCNKAKAQIWQTRSSPPALVTASLPSLIWEIWGFLLVIACMYGLAARRMPWEQCEEVIWQQAIAAGTALYEFIKLRAAYLKAHILDHCYGAVPHMLRLCTAFLTKKPQYSPRATLLVETPKRFRGWRLVSFPVSLVVKTAQNQWKKGLPTSPEHHQSLPFFPKASKVLSQV